MQLAFSRIVRVPEIGARVRDAYADSRFGRVTDRAPQLGMMWIRWDDGTEEAVSTRCVIAC